MTSCNKRRMAPRFFVGIHGLAGADFDDISRAPRQRHGSSRQSRLPAAGHLACSKPRHCSMQCKQVRTGPGLGTLACACSSLSRRDAKWEHFVCQPWIPVGDEYLLLISHRLQYNTSRQTFPLESPVRSRSIPTCVTVASLHPRSPQRYRPHAPAARYRSYRARTHARPQIRRHEREQQHAGCEQDGDDHFLTIRMDYRS